MSEWKINPNYPDIQYQDDFLDLTKIEDLIIKETGPTKAMQKAWAHAMLYGSGAYTVGVDTSRDYSKSVVNMITGHIGSVDQFRMIVIPTTGHAFTKGVYHYLYSTAKSRVPRNSYYLLGTQWYFKAKHKSWPIYVAQVPKAYRLQLKLMHINQPE